MPNPENVESPIVIVGAGRSGTSLLSSLFERHPDFSYAGEVVNLIFGVWSAAEDSLNGMPELLDGGGLASPTKRAGRAVRSSLLSLCPTPQKNWCIKPIGIPRALTDRFTETAEWDQTAEYYWKVMRESFPGARYLMVLRHPCDVVISSCARWGHDPKTIWWSLGLMAHILAHKNAPRIQAVSFERLAGQGETEVKAIMAALSLPFHPDVLKAFSAQHATEREVGDVQAKRGSRREQWAGLLAEDLPDRYRTALDRLFKHFGHAPIEWPPQFKSSAQSRSRTVTQSPGPAATEAGSKPLLATIAALNRAVDQANVRCESTLLDQSRRFDQIWREQQNYLQSLAEAIKWHEQQSSTLTEELASARTKLGEATQWFDSQAGHAKAEQDSLQQALLELRAWNQLLLEAKDWHAAQLDGLAGQLREASRLAAEQKSWHERQLAEAHSAAHDLRTEAQQLRAWNAELVKAKDWHAGQLETLATQMKEAQRLLLEQKQWSDMQLAESLAAVLQLREWNDKLVEAKDWHATQLDTLTRQLQEATRHATGQKLWHEQQLANAQTATDALHTESRQLRAWNAELVKAKDWHAAQLETLTAQLEDAQRALLGRKQWSDTQLAESLEVVQQLRDWNEELVKAKDWHAAQLDTLGTQLQAAVRLAAEQKLWSEQQLANAQAATDALRDESRQLRAWNAELVKAKDWQAAQNDTLALQLKDAQRLFLEQQQWSDTQLAELSSTVRELREWNDKLVEAKGWHAAQLETLAAQLRASAQLAAEQQQWNEEQAANAAAAADALRTESQQLRDWNAELIKAKDWHAAQNEALIVQLKEASRLTAEQKLWSEQQLANARTAAGILEAELAKLRDWNAELIKAKDWHASHNETLVTQLKEASEIAAEQRRWDEQQLANAQAAAEVLHTESRQLRDWNAELVKAKDWHAAQTEALATQLAESARLAAGQKLWNEQQLAHAQAATDSLQAEFAKLRDWNAELVKAKDWHAAQNEALVQRINEADRIFREQQEWIAALESAKK